MLNIIGVAQFTDKILIGLQHRKAGLYLLLCCMNLPQQFLPLLADLQVLLLDLTDGLAKFMHPVTVVIKKGMRLLRTDGVCSHGRK